MRVKTVPKRGNVLEQVCAGLLMMPVTASASSARVLTAEPYVKDIAQWPVTSRIVHLMCAIHAQSASFASRISISTLRYMPMPLSVGGAQRAGKAYGLLKIKEKL